MAKRDDDHKMKMRLAIQRAPDTRPWEARRYSRLSEAPCWRGTVMVDCGRWSWARGEVAAIYAVSQCELYICDLNGGRFAGMWGPVEAVARFTGEHHANSVLKTYLGRRDVVGPVAELAGHLMAHSVVMSGASMTSERVAA